MNRIIPSTSRGKDDFKDLITGEMKPVLPVETPLASGDTIAFEIMNDPTPTSMSPLPKVSAFARRRGKMAKSTASIAMAVAITTYALKLPIKGLFPDISEERIV